MRITLTTQNDRSVEIDLSEEQLAHLGLIDPTATNPKPRTGYERADEVEKYYYSNNFEFSGFGWAIEELADIDNTCYQNADYYNDENLARANARADRLLRQLRREAAMNGGIPRKEDWGKSASAAHYIYYDHSDQQIAFGASWCCQWIGGIYFLDENACKAAIEKYHDELIWYFTKYETMLYPKEA